MTGEALLDATVAGQECLSAALEYLQRGWSVLACCPPDHVGVGKKHAQQCQSPGKAPWGPWLEYQDQLPTEAQLRKKWKDNPLLNVGLALGPVSGLVRIDVDGPGGEDILRELSGGDLPKTLEFTSGRANGGRGLLYKIPGGVQLKTTPMRSEEAKQELRFQAKGAQTVLPPSRHPSGCRYQWVAGYGPGEIEPAMMPAWLVERMRAGNVGSNDRASRNGRAEAVNDKIKEGGRNSTLASLAGSMRRRGMGQAAILAALREENASRCDPPLEDVEVTGIAAKISKYAPDKAPSQLVKVETFTAAELSRLELADPLAVVKDVVPEGLVVFAGKPKLGKSFLMLNVALAVATGGCALGKIQVEAGRVLYLALEDTKRRLQGRLEKMLAVSGADDPPEQLSLATRWPRQDEGGLLSLLEWLDKTPAKLVVIDTWARFRPPKIRGGNEYEQDYLHASEVKALADQRGVTIVIVSHTRKMAATDAVDEVSGTLGLTGAADGVLVLKRERGQHDGVLFVTGRDLEEQELALRWDGQYCLWSIAGAADEYRVSRERAAVLELLRKENRPMKPAEAAPLLAKKRDAVKYLMWSLEKEGWLKSDGHGAYGISPNTTNPPNATNSANRTNRVCGRLAGERC